MSEQAILEALLDDPGLAVMIGDAQNRILRVNPTFESLTGYQSFEVAGASTRLFDSGRHEPAFFADIQAVLSERGRWAGNVYVRLKSGDVRPMRVALRVVRAADGHVTNHVTTLREPDLAHDGSGGQQATHDSLTGLPNQSLFDDRIAQALLGAKRTGKSVAVIMIGLDRFSLINDGLGHDTGDALLSEVGRRLLHCVRQSDTTARLSGDRFALVMPVAAPQDSVLVAEKVIKSIAEPFVIDDHKVVQGASIGISLFPSDAGDTAALIDHAHSAMRHAKKVGGNRYQFYASDMNQKARQRLALEASLRRALENDEYRVYYQPKVEMGSNDIVGMEALVRWQDPQRGLVPPGEFIPVAEEVGLISPIGYWVMKEACRQNRAWQKMGLKPVRVAVNMSGRQFKEKDIVERVARVLDDTLLDPHYLEVEITESMLMDDIEQAIAKLHRLRDLGVHLSIDDFGTGYSSLSYLSRFPVTTLKIDRAFVHDLETNPNTAEIARAIIGLSRGLKLEVVAEGAETLAHVDFLRDQGCDMVQGFYFSRPVPAEAFENMLRTGSLNPE